MALKPAARKQYQPFATGKKVYSNGTNAPTRGTVNPAGYIRREMRSNRRSGLAKAAINRVERPGTRGGVMRPKNSGSVQRPKPVINAQQLKHFWDWTHGKGGPKGPSAPAKPSQPKPANPGSTPVGSTHAPAVPKTMNVTENGQLDLPYDNQFGWDLLGAKQDMNSSLLDLQAQQQQQALNYGQQKRDAGQQYEKLQQQTLNSDAARGMAFSSGYGKHVGENATSYNNFVGDLDAQNNLFNQNVDLQRNQIGTGFNQMLQMAALARAQGLAPDAGNLGFGQATAEPGMANPFVQAAKNKIKKKSSSKSKPASKKKVQPKRHPKKPAGFRAERGKGVTQHHKKKGKK